MSDAVNRQSGEFSPIEIEGIMTAPADYAA
jgi:hypothetical protein